MDGVKELPLVTSGVGICMCGWRNRFVVCGAAGMLLSEW